MKVADSILATLAASLESDARFAASLPFTAYDAPKTAAPGIPENGSGVTRRTTPTFLSVFDMFGGSTTIFILLLVSGLPTDFATSTRSCEVLANTLTLAFASLTSLCTVDNLPAGC